MVDEDVNNSQIGVGSFPTVEGPWLFYGAKGRYRPRARLKSATEQQKAAGASGFCIEGNSDVSLSLLTISSDR